MAKGRVPMRPSLLLILIASLMCASCATTPPPATHAAATRPAPTTLPMKEVSKPKEVDRLAQLHPSINGQWLAYLAKEGDSHRSDQFAIVAGILDKTCFSGRFVKTRT